MKGKRPRRKVIVFLVDGYSEHEALYPAISALYDSIDPNYEVFFPPMCEDGKQHMGDLTSKFGINPKTIEKCISKLYFENFLQENKLYPKDISEVVHIVDTDGAYITDDNIQYGVNPLGSDKTYYANETIITDNVDGIKERNLRKRENIDYLCSLDKIKIGSKTIPYSIYFFSSNLDHFLYNDANIIEGQEKVNRATQYANSYVEEPELFMQSIKATPGALINMNLQDSWDFIRQRGSNSICRHTNINILFDKLIAETE